MKIKQLVVVASLTCLTCASSTIGTVDAQTGTLSYTCQATGQFSCAPFNVPFSGFASTSYGSAAFEVTNTGDGIGILGSSSHSFGVYGASTDGYGVYGTSTNTVGVYGYSPNNFGLAGISNNSVGVYGYSATGASAWFRGGSGGNGSCYYNGGSNWTCSSDRNLKENFIPVDVKNILQQVNQLPITRWNMKGGKITAKHIGPMAQDFHALFAVGEDDKLINTGDVQGVTLAAIQGLYKVVLEKDNQLQKLVREKDTQLQEQGAKIVHLQNQIANLQRHQTEIAQLRKEMNIVKIQLMASGSVKEIQNQKD
ncbi:MAG: tail fiber domain-containing protein [Chroococcidiopsidaceae cyanobacterium CP_BM_ER_R8_30]|nr:tail fiber domain-containing protein [Chroococcidiopsidaceae cyanobacterium CP_BM_ER_R8_30]